MTNDVPLEGVLKYIKKERDKYKEKLDVLKEYTKLLEEKFNKALKIIEEKDAEIEALKEENKSLRTDVKNTKLWQDFKASNRIKDLKLKENKITLSRLTSEIYHLKKALANIDSNNPLIDTTYDDEETEEK